MKTIHTDSRLEPNIKADADTLADIDTIALLSCAISLKRIADAAEKIAECIDDNHQYGGGPKLRTTSI
jgi:hypothetical protein